MLYLDNLELLRSPSLPNLKLQYFMHMLPEDISGVLKQIAYLIWLMLSSALRISQEMNGEESDMSLYCLHTKQNKP